MRIFKVFVVVVAMMTPGANEGPRVEETTRVEVEADELAELLTPAFSVTSEKRSAPPRARRLHVGGAR